MTSMMSPAARAKRRGALPPQASSSQDVMAMDPERRRWLEELLIACEKSGRLNGWEVQFTSGIGRRLALQGDKMVLTMKQLDVLLNVEEKVHAAG